LFDVYVDESVIYSNRREGGRLPKNEDVLQRMRDFLSDPAQPEKGKAARKGQAKAGKPEGTSGGQCGCG
jgi:predicted Rdx family selenoprotein